MSPKKNNNKKTAILGNVRGRSTQSLDINEPRNSKSRGVTCVTPNNRLRLPANWKQFRRKNEVKNKNKKIAVGNDCKLDRRRKALCVAGAAASSDRGGEITHTSWGAVMPLMFYSVRKFCFFFFSPVKNKSRLILFCTWNLGINKSASVLYWIRKWFIHFFLF